MPQNAFFLQTRNLLVSQKKTRRHFFSILHPLSAVIFATATVLAFVLLCDSKFNFHCYTQHEATPTQKSAQKCAATSRNFLRERLQSTFTLANQLRWIAQQRMMRTEEVWIHITTDDPLSTLSKTIAHDENRGGTNTHHNGWPTIHTIQNYSAWWEQRRYEHTSQWMTHYPHCCHRRCVTHADIILALLSRWWISRSEQPMNFHTGKGFPFSDSLTKLESFFWKHPNPTKMKLCTSLLLSQVARTALHSALPLRHAEKANLIQYNSKKIFILL